ncbi:MAG: hypothetical protein WCK70_09535 [Chloroflexales bacterium]
MPCIRSWPGRRLKSPLQSLRLGVGLRRRRPARVGGRPAVGSIGATSVARLSGNASVRAKIGLIVVA